MAVRVRTIGRHNRHSPTPVDSISNRAQFETRRLRERSVSATSLSTFEFCRRSNANSNRHLIDLSNSTDHGHGNLSLRQEETRSIQENIAIRHKWATNQAIGFGVSGFFVLILVTLFESILGNGKRRSNLPVWSQSTRSRRSLTRTRIRACP